MFSYGSNMEVAIYKITILHIYTEVGETGGG